MTNNNNSLTTNRPFSNFSGNQATGDEFLSLLSSRHSKRRFLSGDCPSNELISKILEAAAEGTPSTKNTQPWGVSVVKGTALKQLSSHLLEKFDRIHGQLPEAKESNGTEVFKFDAPEYPNRPENPTLEEFDERIARFGKEMFAWKGVDRYDEEHRRMHDRANYEFFGAPLLILLHVPERAVAGTFLDAGLFLQSLLLAFHSYGYGACPQYSLTRFSTTIRKFHETQDGMKPLIPEGRIMTCGISVGVVDTDNKVNHFAPSRNAVENWSEFFDDEEEQK